MQLYNYTLGVASLFSSFLFDTAAAQESPNTRSYFYIGGEYVNTSAGHVFQDQMYVEKISPIGGPTKPYPVVFLHGGGQTGTNWLNKPDGGRGWASLFIDWGYEIYIVDQAHTGRSSWFPGSDFVQTESGAETTEQRFTDVQKYMLWPQARLHTQWPGNGSMGDPIFDTYFASTVQFLSNGTQQEITMKSAGVRLLDKIGPVVMIAHSLGALYAWSWTDARPDLVKALIQIEPKGPPFREAIFSTDITRPWGLTSIPLTFSPAPSNFTAPLTMRTVPSTSSDRTDCIIQHEPARKLTSFKNVPILIENGEASYHAVYDYCFELFLKQAGCEKVEYLPLADIEIHGNAHLQFLELNSDAIAEVLERWIVKAVAV